MGKLLPRERLHRPRPTAGDPYVPLPLCSQCSRLVIGSSTPAPLAMFCLPQSWDPYYMVRGLFTFATSSFNDFVNLAAENPLKIVELLETKAKNGFSTLKIGGNLMDTPWDPLFLSVLNAGPMGAP